MHYFQYSLFFQVSFFPKLLLQYYIYYTFEIKMYTIKASKKLDIDYCKRGGCVSGWWRSALITVQGIVIKALAARAGPPAQLELLALPELEGIDQEELALSI